METHTHHEHHGMAHETHGEMQHDHESMMHGAGVAADFLRRFFIVTALLIPLFVFSMVGQSLFKYPDFPFRPYLEFGISTLIFLVGLVFFEHARHEIMARKLGMMTLVSVAVGAGYLFSVASTFIPGLETEFYLEISSLIWVLLFGHYLEARSSTAAGDALEEVAKLLPKRAHRITNGEMLEVDVTELREGDTVLIKPGEKVPADGVIVKGRSHFNEAHITGESKPVEKREGDNVVAGAIAEDGAVEVRLTKVGEHSTIGQIQKLIASAKSTKPSAQRIADRAAGALTVIALAVALLTLLVWSAVLGQPLAFSLTLAITVLVIACPHALGLAIPTVSTIATKKSVSHGIFIKDMSKLEIAKDTDYVIFDKTGTLTEGAFKVTDVIQVANTDKQTILSIAAALEQSSSHVIGLSVVTHAREQGLTFKPVEDFTNLAGKGVEGRVGNNRYYVGNRSLMAEKGLLSDRVNDIAASLKNRGETIVYMATETEITGIITLADRIKPTAHKAIDYLHTLGIKVAMITGDNEEVAKTVAGQLSIDTYFANVRPESKYVYVKKLQDEGNIVVMVGDGVNDAPALTQANVGIAIGAGTDVAVEAGDVVLTRNDPSGVPAFIVLSKKVYRKMLQNLWWALGYNLIAIPAAAGVFIPFGFQLSPQTGAIAMALSSVIVVINAISLRRESLSVA